MNINQEGKNYDFPETEGLQEVFSDISREFLDPVYSLEKLEEKYHTFYKTGFSGEEQMKMLLKAAVELTTQEAPKWEMIAARIRLVTFRNELKAQMKQRNVNSFYEKICYLTKENLYGAYILENYTEEEITAFEKLMREERDHLFNYSGLELLLNRYVIRDQKGVLLESPQEMFLGIAMHLAMKEPCDRSGWVEKFYNMLSELQVTVATPTLAMRESRTTSFPPALSIQCRTVWMEFIRALIILRKSANLAAEWECTLEKCVQAEARSVDLREQQEV